MKKQPCRCCGKHTGHSDEYPRLSALLFAFIHTKCIRRHWMFHAKGLNSSRCKEFKQVQTADAFWKGAKQC